jgi:hypothetical protein
MNPMAALMVARSLEDDRQRATERRRMERLEPRERPATGRLSWATVARFPRYEQSGAKG